MRQTQLAVALVVLALGCGNKGGIGFDDDGAAGDGSIGDEAPFINSDGGEGGGQCTTCSADLHSVLDCNTSQVVTTCPGDQGCGANGQCVPACDSAKDNKSSIGCEYYAAPPDG